MWPGVQELLLPNDRYHKGGSIATSFIDNMSNLCASANDDHLTHRFDSVHAESPQQVYMIMDAPTNEVRYPKRKREAIDYSYVDCVGEILTDINEDESQDERPSGKKSKSGGTKKEKPLPKKMVFPFLELPPELRNKVYQYALSDPKGHYIVAERRNNRRVGVRVYLNTFKIQSPNKYQRWQRQQQLLAGVSEDEKQEGWQRAILQSKWLRINKAIYEEAIGYLYSSKFIFADTNALHDFLTMIGPRMRARLREVEVAEWGYTSAHKAMNYPSMSLLADAINLERVWLNICHWQGTLNQKIFRDCATFLLAYGFAHGRKDAAVDIIQLPSSDDEKRPWQLQRCTRKPEDNRKVLESLRDYVIRA